MGITRKKIDDLLESFILTNTSGMKVTIINYGATIAWIEVPDRSGKIADVVLGHADLRDYVGGRFYLGATVGRYANRIAGGRFTLDGHVYQVTVNSKGNHLHGGAIGFDKKYWGAKIMEELHVPTLELSLVSTDGEEGFPGRMDAKVLYTLTENNELKIGYVASCDKPTIINLTNHSYFNLTGSPANSILDHILTVNADKFTMTDGMSIPTGEIDRVDNTPLDFRRSTRIGDRIDANFEQTKLSGGYDQNFVLDNYDGSLRRVASAYDPSSGRLMEVYTDQPGMQFYSGNYLDGAVMGKGGAVLSKRSGFCLECQHFPDSPNHKEFPSVVLRPGETYKQDTIYKFSTK